MKKIVEFLKNPLVIAIIGLIALSLLIWFAGPSIKFGENNSAPLGSPMARLVLIIMVLMIWGMHTLWKKLQEKKHNAELVDDLQENQAGQARDHTSSQSAEEIQVINERFTQALSTLKRLKFKGKGQNKALYELPWYIIIGPPGSGKTTALINSSLNFPLAEQFGKGALQGVGGTRNCDWWFTNEAVLIDTAGRYTTQDSHKVVDSSAWEGFLGLLKRNRRRRPINGAIIAISLLDLLSQTEEERVMHAKTIRTRIDELMEKLEIRFPIYLMFTKTDLLSGFSEFFEDMSKDDREQVWGVSLPDAPHESQSPDFDFLGAEYERLVSRLFERVLFRVNQERDPKRRGLIQGFPQQMENLRPIAENFVRQTFVKNRYRYQPYLRGVYFTSGTQDGTPIDRLMSSVSANFGFSRDLVQAAHSQGKSFFLGQLFKSVIFPEAELVGSNRKYETILLWSQRAAYAGMVGFAILLFFVWAGSVTQHKIYMAKVEEFIAEYKAESRRVSDWDRDLRAILKPLNALGKASVVYNQEQHPWLSGMGLYDSNVDNAADRAYEKQLEKLLLPKLLLYLETTLGKGDQGGDLYSTFKTYMMFHKLKHMDKKQVMDWFSANWEENMRGEAKKRTQLLLHLGSLLNADLTPADVNPRVVQNTRIRLKQVPVAQRVYSRIRSKAENAQKVDLLNMFGESVRSSFRVDERVHGVLATPFMFTREGYNLIKDNFTPDSPMIADTVNEKWVLSDDESSKLDYGEGDIKQISAKVKDLYMSDYLRHWETVYTNLAVVPFTDLRHANEVLSSFADQVYSPLLGILKTGKENTTLSNQMAADFAEDNKEGNKGKFAQTLASVSKMTVVDKQFRNVNLLLRETASKPAAINAVMDRIRQLQSFVYEISVAPDPGKMAFDTAKARYQSGAGNAITSLKAFSRTTPRPVQNWLDALSDETWKVVLASAHQHVNTQWRNMVYTPYSRALAGRYPINRSASDELALFDFSAFFKPGGTMDVFYLEYLKPFVNTTGGWSNRVIDSHSLGLSSGAIAQVYRAQKIKDIFFRGNPEIPGLTFELRPFTFQKSDACFALEVGKDNVRYCHGPKLWNTVKWSGEDENNRARVIFTDLQERQHPKSFDGPWAWFRVLDNSSVIPTRKSNVFLVTFNVDEKSYASDRPGASSNRVIKHEIKYELKAKSVDNPFKDNLLSSFRVPEGI
ncbi:MAG: type VI secretion system membrane subunit TssM [Gammaproteobacteria bacterium]|nr:type VI secretion system membrane subunit TssM [Gammaproteobacteria bacterium]MDH5652771.1 type VI secretion system membrane subunit TssM [Gammaproteobacteria bacterium]